ncbi:SH3 domain-containing protein [Proteiniclasticum sp. C24MP]|uniref:SH3 domain-containing protein n=1 Tax=Proteiniclasticum sp. C24MP TaxID=3374101 RepID=UPI003754F313
MKAADFLCRMLVSLFLLLLSGTFLSHHADHISLFSAKQNQVAVEASETMITTANLNMRTGPGTGYSVITVIPKGAKVIVNGYSGDWAKVTYSGKNGYAHSSYLKIETGVVRYTTTNLNMRTGPGTSYAVILVIPKGAEVTVIDTSSIWYKVSYGGKTGYASSSYLSTSAPAELPVRYTTADLNLRTGPGTGYSIILTMPRGSKVSILDTKYAWPRVRYGTREGYASPLYLSSTPPSTLPETSPSGAPAVVINKGNVSSSVKRIALTFDDYGTAAQIRSILASLKSYGAKGTFFPNGDFVKNNPILIREIAAGGHSVESHTYAHKDLTRLSDAEIRDQIRLAKNAIYSAIGKYPLLVRPPYGAYDTRTRTIAGQEGVKYFVLWSVDTSDWATVRDGVTITTDYVINTAVNNASQNGIILMHMHSDKTVSGLPTILKRLRDAGYQFVTVNEMVN